MHVYSHVHEMNRLNLQPQTQNYLEHLIVFDILNIFSQIVSALIILL